MLRNQFRGFQAVGGKLYAVAVLLEHASDEFTHADGIVGHHDDAFRLDAIDGFGRNGASRNGRRARRENARGARVGLERPALVRRGSDHAVQVDEQNQTAVRRDGRAREQLYAAKIFAEVLNYDFVFAQDFFDHQPNLMVSGVCNDHPVESVNGCERGQPKIGIQANDFGNDVTHLGQQFSAHVFDFVGAQATNLFDNRQRQREIGRAAAHKKCGRNDQRQRNLERELGALAGGALDFDFAVQRI